MAFLPICRCADIGVCRYADIADIFISVTVNSECRYSNIGNIGTENICRYPICRYWKKVPICRYCRYRYKYRHVLRKFHTEVTLRDHELIMVSWSSWSSSLFATLQIPQSGITVPENVLELISPLESGTVSQVKHCLG